MDKLAVGQAVEMRLDVEHAGDNNFFTYLDPAEIFEGPVPPMTRPHFFAIISSTLLAQTLARKATGKVNGFIVEGATAGGHNAPPRGTTEYDENGEPIYGPRDIPDIAQIAAIGLPFWMAGNYGTPEKLAEARAMGAQGVQVGTAFAFCEESGMLPEFKKKALEMSRLGTASVFTDARISPTGFPFKMLNLPGTLAIPEVYEARERICDAGFLRHTYCKADGTVGYRCPSEPVEQYLRKGGTLEDTVRRGCVCNGLSATVGLPQVRKDGYIEEAMITAGNDAVNIKRYAREGEDSYTAEDVIKYLLS
jgi:nitronate monooxygenase